MAIIDRRGFPADQTDSALLPGDPGPGLAIKTPCRAATTGNIVLSGLQTIDGVSLSNGDRVLVKDQSDTTTNGIYSASSGNWTRTRDWDGAHEIVQGTHVLITQGTINVLKTFSIRAADPLIIGTSNVTIAELAPGPELAAIAALGTTGLMTRLGVTSYATRSIVGGAGIAVTNGNGVSANPSIAVDITGLTVDASPDGAADYALTYDASAGAHKKVLLQNLTMAVGAQPADATLTALAALNSTAGFLVETAADVFAKRTLQPPAAGITITNPAGVAGDPTLVLANDLAAYEGLSGTGIVARTATDAAAVRTITGTSNRLTVTNGDGVSGNPTLDISSSYVGQSTITTLGTIGTGTWQGTAVAAGFGGTGLASYTIGDLLYASGTTALSKLAAVAAGRLLASAGTGTAPAYTATPTLGVAGTTLGTLALAGNTSGTATITPQAAAGSPTLTLPNASGTFAVNASAPLALSATTGALTWSGAAFTKTDDTNVTATLGGAPTTAVGTAMSFTLGWTGTLAVARGGTGTGSASGTALDNISGFASTGLLNRTGAGTYAFKTAPTGTVVGTSDTQALTNKDLSGAGNTFPTFNQNTTGSAATLTTSRNIDGQAFNGSADITVIAPGTHAATGKTTPVDADELPLVDSAASNVLKKLTWANLKATLKTYFDTLYQAVIATSTTSYSPTLTSQGGSLTTATASGAYIQFGKFVYVSVAIAITTNGTGSTYLKVTLPVAPASTSNVTFAGNEGGLTGKMIQGILTPGIDAIVRVRYYDASYPGGDGANMVFSGWYIAA